MKGKLKYWFKSKNEMIKDVSYLCDMCEKYEKAIKKLNATVNCIKDSEQIKKGEYYIIHSDFIIALEEELYKLKGEDI